MRRDAQSRPVLAESAPDPAILDPVIRVRGLTKRFGSQTVFENLDLDVTRGEVLGVVGASGTGKSVLLRCLTGLEPIMSGNVDIFGSDTRHLTGREQRSLDQRWGVLFQDGALFGGMTVAQNVALPMREHLSMRANTMRELADLKIAMVGLPADAAEKYPAELSGGMRKRAGLARALALEPELLFLDEPTSGLDPIGAASFDALILQLQQTLGLTVVMVTHDLDSLFATCDRVAVLADQHIVRTAKPAELAAAPGHPWIAAYFNGERARARLHTQVTTTGVETWKPGPTTS
jgi:phospholipid/cholesterol/gamma-HCH transport system ATP-binding protein